MHLPAFHTIQVEMLLLSNRVIKQYISGISFGKNRFALAERPAAASFTALNSGSSKACFTGWCLSPGFYREEGLRIRAKGGAELTSLELHLFH